MSFFWLVMELVKSTWEALQGRVSRFRWREKSEKERKIKKERQRKKESKKEGRRKERKRKKEGRGKDDMG